MGEPNKVKVKDHSNALRSSQGNHTPTPWRVNGHHIERSNGQSIAATIRDTWSPAHEQQANARRIVACANACEGIETAALEAGKFADGTIHAERDQLRKQNKELAQALRLTLKLLEAAGVVEGVAQQSARAILAKLS